MQSAISDNDEIDGNLAAAELVRDGSATGGQAVRATGRRAARIASVIAEIDNGFSERQFSTRTVADRLGLSVRYIQDLAKDNGFGITERILELRLQKAHAILMEDRSCMHKVGDVAALCGFNEVSHFHRCFRRRFGVAPARFRAEAGRGIRSGQRVVNSG
jgi:transcriptional regulator GlxA family with amidase domain